MKKVSLAPMMVLLLSAFSFAQAGQLDSRLADLVAAQKAASLARPGARLAQSADEPAARSGAMFDAAGRVLVDIHLDGREPLAVVVERLKASGAEVTGVNPYFRNGTVSAYVPVDQIEALAASSGLKLMKMSLRPAKNVGLVTSQGTKVLRSDVANASGYNGSGITVGVLSDSYNASPASFTTIRAPNDIASGDLRVPKLVIDLAADPSNTDEGRAMMQIVQDVAPMADQCFATAFAGESAFAANIRTLRTNPVCNADIIVDDVFYFDEPFFSDGEVAEAVNDVVNSSTLPGKKVSYFSSAGNQGGASVGGGSIDVPNASFSTAPTGLGNINLASVATCNSAPATGSTKANVAGGWLNFGGGVYTLPLSFTSSGSTFIMQWDDLFYQGKVTTDLNFYMFNSAGNCVFSFASNNLADDNAIEVIDLGGGPNTTYRIMVGRTNAGTNQATRVRLVNLGGWGGAPLNTPSNPTTFGHSAAASANSVAAYRYTVLAPTVMPYKPGLEGFSSPGPSTIYFDAAGNRLAVPETRKKPDMAATDGGDTTFFYPGQDYEGNGRPNFFGTSAAAPHAAGVAALMLQKAGGAGSLTPKQVKSIMQTAAPARVVPFSGGSATKLWSLYDGFGLIDAVESLNKLN
jgi:hypothetical protein